MAEALNFHVEFLKERYFKLAGLPWEFQTPVTKEMVCLVFEKRGIEDVVFDFNRNSAHSYTLNIQTADYTPDRWQSLKQDITAALG